MKRPLCLWGLLLLLVAVVPAMADSISPTSFTATIPIVGGTATVHKTVTVDAGAPTSNKVDVYFLADTTGSMGGAIGGVIASAASILSTTAGMGDVQFAVGEYKDFGDSYVYRLNTAMTANQATAQAGINAWSASGGGDTFEAQLFAMNALTGAGTGWRTGSERILVWMGDEPGHDPSGGITEAAATAALIATGISVEAADVGNLNGTGQALRIANATGGHYYSGLNSFSIATAIQNAITTAFSTYTNVGLDLSEAPVGGIVTAVSVPGSHTGSFDRSSTQTFEFDVTFTGVAPGTDSFNIYATVDGGRVATEADRITVGAVPEPGSILLFGTLLVGIAGAMRRRSR